MTIDAVLRDFPWNAFLMPIVRNLLVTVLVEYESCNDYSEKNVKLMGTEA